MRYKRASLSDSPRGTYDQFSARFAMSFRDQAPAGGGGGEVELLMVDGNPFLLVDGGSILLRS